MRVETVVWGPLKALLLASSALPLPSHYFQEAPVCHSNVQLETYTSSLCGYGVITGWGSGTVDG